MPHFQFYFYTFFCAVFSYNRMFLELQNRSPRQVQATVPLEYQCHFTKKS